MCQINYYSLYSRQDSRKGNLRIVNRPDLTVILSHSYTCSSCPVWRLLSSGTYAVHSGRICRNSSGNV